MEILVWKYIIPFESPENPNEYLALNKVGGEARTFDHNMSSKVSNRSIVNNYSGVSKNPELAVVSTGSRRKIYAPTRSADDSGSQSQSNNDISYADWESISVGSAPVVGLENLGNTCFMNCSLQQLLHVQPLVEYFMRDDVLNNVNKEELSQWGPLCKFLAVM